MELALIELVLVFGVVLGLGIWQLVDVHRAQRRDRDRRDGDGEP